MISKRDLLRDALKKKLEHSFEGELRVDLVSRRVFSVDASIFEIEPLAIAIPKTKEALETCIQAALELNIPVTARGAATGITGGALGEGLILDTSKYLNRLISVDSFHQIASLEPGIVQDTLNQKLKTFGLRLGPDTSTGNRATLGGMLANNAAGARSLFFGSMIDHIQKVELQLSSGSKIIFEPLDEAQWKKKCQLETQEGKIYQTLDKIRKEKKQLIENAFPKSPRCVSGYALQWLTQPFPLNPCKLLAGSEGTLGITLTMDVSLSKTLQSLGLCLIHFNSQQEAFETVEEILKSKPLSLEMIDQQIIEAGKASPLLRFQLNWLKPMKHTLFVVEFTGDTFKTVQEKLLAFSLTIQPKLPPSAFLLLTQDPKEMQAIWDLRKAGLGLLLSKRSYNRAIAFIEDIAVPPKHLSSFMKQFSSLLKNYHKEAGIYGHVGAGCLHIRPYMNLRDPKEIELIPKIMQEVLTLLLPYQGVLSGEHGDGYIRSWLNPKLFGKELYPLFQEIKTAFDPLDLMNPGKIVQGHLPLKNLRLDAKTPFISLPLYQNFNKEGGVALSVDLCNGNGSCRKGSGLMCPSYQATQDEFHTTRARAQTLRSVIHGQIPLDQWTSKEVFDVLDLCLECKGCKTECPSQVDMAKMKAEFLYHYQKEKGRSLRSVLFAHIGKLFFIFSYIAPLFNKTNQYKITKRFLSYLGITEKRTLPSLSKQRFSTWFKKRPVVEKEKKVCLQLDTYTEFNEPEVGIAATKVLEALGFQVLLAPWKCCGRPFISKGFLKEAKKSATELFLTLKPFVLKKIPIIGLEPSCLFTIKDDFSSFIEETIPLCYTFDAFIEQELKNHPHFFPPSNQTYAIHTHCHQKALEGEKSAIAILEQIPGAKVVKIPSGCCGMAGSFGYEKEHYSLSIKIAELVLFPWIRNKPPETIVIANGISCRSQITHGTQSKPIHLASALFEALKKRS